MSLRYAATSRRALPMRIGPTTGVTGGAECGADRNCGQLVYGEDPIVVVDTTSIVARGIERDEGVTDHRERARLFRLRVDQRRDVDASTALRAEDKSHVFAYRRVIPHPKFRRPHFPILFRELQVVRGHPEYEKRLSKEHLEAKSQWKLSTSTVMTSETISVPA